MLKKSTRGSMNFQNDKIINKMLDFSIISFCLKRIFVSVNFHGYMYKEGKYEMFEFLSNDDLIFFFTYKHVYLLRKALQRDENGNLGQTIILVHVAIEIFFTPINKMMITFWVGLINADLYDFIHL